MQTGSAPKLSLLNYSSSICNLLCVEVLLFGYSFVISCIVRGLDANHEGFVICSCGFVTHIV